ncbi:hypothetical protein ACQKGL_11165, partial [Ensifer adhaerens]|uniref:hypothetical protein n=1 Tax=Ensifer adhaerens TaxID=106592 RepID=UPI003D057341
FSFWEEGFDSPRACHCVDPFLMKINISATETAICCLERVFDSAPSPRRIFLADFNRKSRKKLSFALAISRVAGYKAPTQRVRPSSIG